VKTLGIIGTGLIGASVGLRARAFARVLGCDRDGEAVAAALERGAIDAIAEREKLYETCDAIVIATPLHATCTELRSISGVDGRWRLLTDVASVKSTVVQAARGVKNFVASHPLAGSAARGPRFADESLFEGRTWAYVPSGNPACEAEFQAFVRLLGARPLALDAAEHDAEVAITSHLPQLLAFLAASQIEGIERGPELCGPAGREILRLASSSFELWREIFEANARNVAAGGRNFAESVIRACNELEAGSLPSPPTCI
jgi:prephenate dehydrogenase